MWSIGSSRTLVGNDVETSATGHLRRGYSHEAAGELGCYVPLARVRRIARPWHPEVGNAVDVADILHVAPRVDRRAEHGWRGLGEFLAAEPGADDPRVLRRRRDGPPHRRRLDRPDRYSDLSMDSSRACCSQSRRERSVRSTVVPYLARPICSRWRNRAISWVRVALSPAAGTESCTSAPPCTVFVESFMGYLRICRAAGRPSPTRRRWIRWLRLRHARCGRWAA